ncbi:MAG: hypothetical protein IT353_08910 [Gemmatimonadaceae bacterium]|nr:hypothetical protein [Gemmatimonadaceae bacterium]
MYTRVALAIAIVVTATGAVAVLSLRLALGASPVAQAPSKAAPRAVRRVAAILPTAPLDSHRWKLPR